MQLPASLQAISQQYYQQYRQSCEQKGLLPLADPIFLTSFPFVWAISEYVAQTCIQYPEILADLFNSKDMQSLFSLEQVESLVASSLEGASSEEELIKKLRLCRHRFMVRVAWRDLMRWSDYSATVSELTWFGQVVIDESNKILYKWLSDKHGIPYDDVGMPQRMVVIALGKLGGRELNFSSDVDLMFAYPNNGFTKGQDKVIDNQRFFLRLAQSLIRVLNHRTLDGFVFRVDMRLRPFGDSGPLVMTFQAMKEYYQQHGRDWERYALVKARSVSGDPESQNQLMAILQGFAYRPYVDYAMIHALRRMHDMIAEEVKKQRLHEDVKRGDGGIRSIEFIGQAFQLIRGGVEHRLKRRKILDILDLLERLRSLSIREVVELKSAYVFLRNLEHRLQIIRDQQTHALPQQEVDQMRVAASMGFEHWRQLRLRLYQHTEIVKAHFNRLIKLPRVLQRQDALRTNLHLIWLNKIPESDYKAIFQKAGFLQDEEPVRLVLELRDSQRCQSLHALNKERLAKIMPYLLAAIGGCIEGSRVEVLKRVLPIIENIVDEGRYLVLLYERPQAMQHLVRLCEGSPWIAAQIASHPELLDELVSLSADIVNQPLLDLKLELSQQLYEIAADNIDEKMISLRIFKHAQVLKAAAADLRHWLPLMKVSDRLTYFAEIILQMVLQVAWDYMVLKHGAPVHEEKILTHESFAILAYGKLGGLELSYKSDLDLVFLHQNVDAQGMTNGTDAVTHYVFYSRLAQLIIKMLTAQNKAGVLYQVDMRLRPAGDSGQLICSVNAWEDYQRQEAWTFEHQALVRARVLATRTTLGRHITKLRNDILATQREPAKLMQDITEMRQKMLDQQKNLPEDRFDIKHSVGGVTDIEFIVQYLVLRYAYQQPTLLHYTDNIRILEAVAASGLLTADQATCLSDAYRLYRQEMHRLALQQNETIIASDSVAEQRQGVIEIWQHLFAKE